MYLAAIPEKQWHRFVIRESYWDRDCFRSRDLVELGPDPSQYIVYPGGRAYYIDPDLEDQIRDQGGDPDPDALVQQQKLHVVEVLYVFGVVEMQRNAHAALRPAFEAARIGFGHRAILLRVTPLFGHRKLSPRGRRLSNRRPFRLTGSAAAGESISPAAAPADAREDKSIESEGRS